MILYLLKLFDMRLSKNRPQTTESERISGRGWILRDQPRPGKRYHKVSGCGYTGRG